MPVEVDETQLASLQNTAKIVQGLLKDAKRKDVKLFVADFDTETAKTAMRYKKSHGWFDFYGVYGTPGV